MSISSGLVKQLAGPVPTGVVDLVPLFNDAVAGANMMKNFSLRHKRQGWVVAACPCQYLPGDGVRVALVFQLPHMGR